MVEAWKADSSEWLAQFRGDAGVDVTWNALWRFLNRPWFFRVLVVQEAVVSKNARLVCGDRECSFKDFVAALRTYYPLHTDFGLETGIEAGLWLQLYVERLGTMKGLSRAIHGSARDIGGMVLPVFHHHETLWVPWSKLGVNSQASEPRDKIFALLGIAPAAEQAAVVKIDYEKPVDEVYVEAAVYFISKYGLQVLQDKKDQITEGLPSWVPGWVTPALIDQGPVREIEGDAYPKSVLTLKLSDYWKVLTLRGFPIDTIKIVHTHELPASRRYVNERDFLPTLIAWEKAVMREYSGPNPYIQIPEGRFEAFWRTLVLNRDYYAY